MSDRPTERAMKAAVDMEVHAACSTQTIAKAEALDGHSPGYDDLVSSLKDMIACYWADGDGDPEEPFIIKEARAALAKAESSR